MKDLEKTFRELFEESRFAVNSAAAIERDRHFEYWPAWFNSLRLNIGKWLIGIFIGFAVFLAAPVTLGRIIWPGLTPLSRGYEWYSLSLAFVLLICQVGLFVVDSIACRHPSVPFYWQVIHSKLLSLARKKGLSQKQLLCGYRSARHFRHSERKTWITMIGTVVLFVGLGERILGPFRGLEEGIKKFVLESGHAWRPMMLIAAAMTLGFFWLVRYAGPLTWFENLGVYMDPNPESDDEPPLSDCFSGEGTK